MAHARLTTWVRRATAPCCLAAAIVAGAPREGAGTPRAVRQPATARPALAAATPGDTTAELERLRGELEASIRAGRHDAAVPLARRLVTLAERTSAASPGALGDALLRLGRLLAADEAWRDAAAAFDRARTLGPDAIGDGPRLDAMIGLAHALQHLEEFPRAEGLLRAAIAQLGAGPGALTRDATPERLAAALAAVGELRRGLGAYAAADDTLARAVSLFGAREDESLDAVDAIHEWGLVALDRGDIGRADSLLQHAMERRVRRLGPDHERVAPSLIALSGVRTQQGLPGESMRLADRALELLERRYGDADTRLVPALQALADSYSWMGDWPRALDLLNRAVRLAERSALPPAATGALLHSLGALRAAGGDGAGADEYFRRAIRQRERTLGDRHPLVALARQQLGHVYRESGDAASAEWLYRRALRDLEPAFGPTSYALAPSLMGLALTLGDRRQHEEAERTALRSLALTRAHYGESHLNTVLAMYHLVALAQQRGDREGELRWATEVLPARERMTTLVLRGGAERQKQQILRWDAGMTSNLVGMHLRTRPEDERLAHLALTELLRRKGRVLDVMAQQMSLLRRRDDPRSRPLLDTLLALRGRLASLVWSDGGSGTTGEFAALRDRAERLEAEASHLTAAVGGADGPIALDAVQRAIPPGGALVEFVEYRPFDPQARMPVDRWGAPRYGAYVLRRDGPPRAVDLGETRRVNRDIQHLRRALASPHSTDVDAAARALDERIGRPVRALVGDATHLLVAPDGLLHLVPFAALLDERGRQLVTRFQLTYLTSGRDLVRLSSDDEVSRAPPVIVAAPDFAAEGVGDGAASPPMGAAPVSDRASSTVQATARGALERGVLPHLDAAGSRTWTALPGTAAEGEALASRLAGVRRLTGTAASEASVKTLAGPSLLHVATHGFFVAPPEAPRSTAGWHPLRAGLAISAPVAPTPDEPLLRSGLALAGANQRRGGGTEDGILTALEVAGLDLHGTALVVLSACETGVGDVEVGEGVLGLRRALVLAGARSQLMSLWKVNDDATTTLMTAYYGELARGIGRSEALRQVQLRMLDDPALRHPYYWAAFLPLGDWRALPQAARPQR